MENNSTKTGLVFSIPSLFNGILPKLENSYFAIFLTDVALLSTAGATKVTSFGSLLISISSLLAGVIMQKVNFKKGKYRPWLIPMSIAIVIGRYMQFTAIDAPESTLIVWFIVGYVVCNFAYSFTSTSYGALGAAIATTPEIRVAFQSYKQIMSNVGGLIFSTFALASIEAIGKNDIRTGYSVVGTITGVLVFVGSIITLYATKNVNDGAYEKKEDIKENAKVSIWEMIKYSIFNRPMICFLFASWLKVGSNIVLAMSASYYFKWYVGDMSLFTWYLSVSTLFAIGGSFITPFVAKFLFKGTRNTYSGALLCDGIVYLAAYLLKENAVAVIVCLSLEKIFWAIYMTAETPLYYGIIDYAEVKSGKDLKAFMMAVNTFCIKFGNVVATTTLGLGLQAIGYEGAAPTAESIHKLPIVVMIIPCVYAVVAGLLVRLIPLPDDKMAEYRAQKEAMEA